MNNFWKFLSFVGSVGTALLVVAFFVGGHSYTTYTNVENPAAWTFFPRGLCLTLMTDDKSAYLALGGAAAVGLQVLMTLLGLLVNFFQTPGRR